MGAALTQERLKELLSYDQASGVFTWNLRPARSLVAGQAAGSKHAKGYTVIRISRVAYFAHRLAWLYMTGEWPSRQVDHINGVRNDNRWCNLRTATQAENSQNQRGPRSDSKSGLLGVTWSKQGKKWQAQIKVDRVNRHLGCFTDKHEAHAAYLRAKAELHPFSTL